MVSSDGQRVYTFPNGDSLVTASSVFMTAAFMCLSQQGLPVLEFAGIPLLLGTISSK